MLYQQEYSLTPEQQKVFEDKKSIKNGFMSLEEMRLKVEQAKKINLNGRLRQSDP